MDIGGDITPINKGRIAVSTIRVCLAVALSLASGAHALATNVEGEASGTWTREGSPYVLTGPVYVRKGNTLRIEPGVEVRSPQGYPFSVIYNGSLYASGATFTGPEFVRGIGLYVAGEDTADISECRFTSYEYGFKFDDGAHPVVGNTTVSGCGYPAWYSGGCAPVYTGGNSFAGNEHDVIALAGVAHSDAAWGVDVLADYVMMGSFTIENGSVILRPGVRVRCTDYGKKPQRFFYVRSAYSDQNPRLSAEGTTFYADSTCRGPMIELFNANEGRSEFKGCEFKGMNHMLDAIICRNSDSVLIQNCGFFGLRYGVSLMGKASAVIRGCTFTQSSGGVLIGAGKGESGAVIEKSCFIGNDDYGVHSMDSLARVTASDNWWGSAAGPKHTADSSGTGDRVSAFVTFTPWLSAEPECGR